MSMYMPMRHIEKKARPIKMPTKALGHKNFWIYILLSIWLRYGETDAASAARVCARKRAKTRACAMIVWAFILLQKNNYNS